MRGVFMLEIEGNVPLHKCSTEHTHTQCKGISLQTPELLERAKGDIMNSKWFFKVEDKYLCHNNSNQSYMYICKI